MYKRQSLWLLLPPVITLALIIKKVDAIPALFTGIIVGVICALIFQQDLLARIISNDSYPMYRLIMDTLFGGVNIVTSNTQLNDLFQSGGMHGMLGTVWLILAAMTFGGVMEASGMIARIMNSVKSLATNFFRLVLCTTGTCIVTNISTSDQYIAVALPGRMYAGLYKDMGYSSENLSRTLEDTGTVTSVLVPWNTCGAYHAAVLGIGTFTYLPFAFFNLLSPLMTLLFAALMIKIKRTPSLDAESLEADRENGKITQPA